MSLAVVFSRALDGVQARLIHVEVHLAGGLPAFSIVGLPEMAVKESKDRVRAAINNTHFEFPVRKITVNLAPADLPKTGSHYDLAIALGILAASKQIPSQLLEQHEFIGELALSGDLRPVRGALPIALQCTTAGRHLILPEASAPEAGLVREASILPAARLLDVCAHLAQQQHLAAFSSEVNDAGGIASCHGDLQEVKGQPQAKRALEIAAAGQHNLLMIGPPGTGKSMLAARMAGILPPMRDSEALETASIASISHEGFDPSRWKQRPFRSPHHTTSGIALVGGGSSPRPGEISLAHNGVLFLDELTEYSRQVLDVLREPLEKGRIAISRAARQAEFPARFQLVAAMNPCPCGYLGDKQRTCRCNNEQIRRYQARISGPLLDRIDLHVRVPRLPPDALQSKLGESSAAVHTRVLEARQRQLQRSNTVNAFLSNPEIERCCALPSEAALLLKQAIERLGLSARAYHRILKVARTIADLTGAANIETPHISEAIGYRIMDREEKSAY